jgi:hypothetical protein
MPLIYLVIVLAVVGLGLWLLETYVPMSQPIKITIRVIVIICLIVWLLQLFGIVGPVIKPIR